MGMSGAPFGQQYGQPGVQQMGPVGVNGQQLPNKTALSNNLAQFPAELKGPGSGPSMVSVFLIYWKKTKKPKKVDLGPSLLPRWLALSLFKNASLYHDRFLKTGVTVLVASVLLCVFLVVCFLIKLWCEIATLIIAMQTVKLDFWLEFFWRSIWIWISL